MEWIIQLAVNHATARAVLEQDRVSNVYALCDLEPPYERYTSVAVARNRRDSEAACLVVCHPGFTGIVTHGPAAGVEALLSSMKLPRHFHVDVPAAHRALIERLFVFTDPHERPLMTVTPQTFRPARSTAPMPVRLGPADLPDLLDLYARYEANSFHSAQLEHGVFYGIRLGEVLVAAGGTPNLALESRIAIVTSVFTRPEVRRYGFGAAVTGAITMTLFDLGCEVVCLDVEVDNLAARRVYERLGYQQHSTRWQGTAALRRMCATSR